MPIWVQPTLLQYTAIRLLDGKVKEWDNQVCRREPPDNTENKENRGQRKFKSCCI